MLNKKDLRVRKTHRALISAFGALLSRRNFNQITINELCEEAFISRATFYTHFIDKYDLLKYCLELTMRDIIKDTHNYEELEHNINQFVIENQKIISNIIKDANSEVLELMNDFMLSIFKLFLKERGNPPSGNHYHVLINFCVGGLTKLLLWQVENNYPPELQMMNQYLYHIMGILTEWNETQDIGGDQRNES